MALLDLSKVTKALCELIRLAVTQSPESEWGAANPLKVLPNPPDKIEEKALGLYLYHLEEDVAHKNTVELAPDPIPVRITPMGLNLYYQLSPHSKDADPLLEQKMMGLAVKTLHDHPVVTDATSVNGTKILQFAGLDGEGNRIRLVLQPLTVEQAVSYWTAGSTPLRLAAYYQVSVVLLEPEEPPAPYGRVLEYGVHTFLVGGPRLEGSSCQVEVKLPGSTTAKKLKVSPAQVSVGETAVFVGTNLSGDRTALEIRGPGWAEPLPVEGLSWSSGPSGEYLTVPIDALVGGRTVVPGIYEARATVTEQRKLPSGEIREFMRSSNRIPFVIVPEASEPGGPTPAGIYVIDGGPFEHADIETVEMYAGSTELELVNAAALSPGEFRVVRADQVRFKPPDGLVSGSAVPVRIFVNGVESTPRWFTA